MNTSIFIKRAGLSTMRVRVFHARPRAKSAARTMIRLGFPTHYICSSLEMSRRRFDRLFGPAALFRVLPLK